MKKGRKQIRKGGLEICHLWGDYAFMLNNPFLKKYTKRKMNKRYRQELKADTLKELEDCND